MFRFSLSHCSTARMSVMRLSSSSTFVSGAIMSDIMESEGPRLPPGCAPEKAEPNGDMRIMPHMRSSISAGGNPGKPGKGGVEPGVSVMLVASLHKEGKGRRAARV